MLPVALIDMNSDDVASSLWFIIVPLAVSVVQHSRKFVYWNVATFSFLVVIYGLPIILKMCNIDTLSVLVSSLYENDTAQNDYVWYAHIFNKIVSIFVLFILVCQCVRYKEKLYNIRMDELYDKLSQNNDTDLITTIKTADKDDESKKYDYLYARIVEYMEINKPFAKEDFSIMQLAFALNTNAAYLSAAINIKRNINFSMFVNTYRIENVKRMIQFNSKKYTLEHIYLSSGFKNQSTFNKAFKLYEGITPTEYIKRIKNYELEITN
jgi:YesN/AraC family two-component response regulator